MKEWVSLRLELQTFFTSQHNIKFLPLGLLAIALSLWEYIGSPFVAVTIGVFAGLEPQINNILFRTPRELEALILLPVSWKRVVLMKNIATSLIACLLFVLTSMATVYFQPVLPSWRECAEVSLYLPTILFPLLYAGNFRSVQHPRKTVGWGLNDVAESLIMLVLVGVFSIPFVVFRATAYGVPLSIAYCLATGLFWLKSSIPRVARRIENESAELCTIA